MSLWGVTACSGEAGGCSTAVSGSSAPAAHLQCLGHHHHHHCCTTLDCSSSLVLPLQMEVSTRFGGNLRRDIFFFMSLQRSSVVFIGRFKQCLLTCYT